MFMEHKSDAVAAHAQIKTNNNVVLHFIHIQTYFFSVLNRCS